MSKIRVVKSTFPGVNLGDVCFWEFSSIGYRLIRIADKKSIFVTAQVDKNGLTKSGKVPILVGLVCHNKSKGWILETEIVDEEITQSGDTNALFSL